MEQVCDKNLCTGCSACFGRCPKSAIQMQEDSLGFVYPVINPELCIECGLCQKVCHILSPVEKNEIKCGFTYAADHEERMKSSSGAMFPLLARHFLAQGYFVAGVIFAPDYRSAHYVVTDDSLVVEKMRKSKYIEAEIGDVFVKIDALLQRGEKVFFTGLPCHVAALKKTVRQSDNLFLMDLMCFGSGSPRIYRESLDAFLRRKNCKALESVDFRRKPFINKSHAVMEICADNQKYVIPARDFPYYYGFTMRYVMRNGCYSCVYNESKRVSDITIGDVNGSNPNKVDDWGENVVFCNTEKGLHILKVLQEKEPFRPMTSDELQEEKNRFLPRSKPIERQTIEKMGSYRRIEKKYLRPKKGLRSLAVRVLKRIKRAKI